MNTIEEQVRAIAMYLPQFHPILENDNWWGKGFTEWTNVTKAKPAFWGHKQPNLPTDLGFYDLRLPEVRDLQAQMAQDSGIHGFCYYHYWFNGKRLLNRPFDEVLSSGKPDFPFCLCWANENWNRRWDGREGNLLIQQNYGKEDDIAHISWLINVFKDSRYIKVDGKPLFIIYRISQLPDPLATTNLWRKEARKCGIGEIFLCGVEGNHPHTYIHVSEVGMDASILFQPSFSYLSKREKIFKRLVSYALNRKGHIIYDYSIFSKRMMSLDYNNFEYTVFPCVTPSWDNTPRRKKDGFILANSTPEYYEKWLRKEVEKLQCRKNKNDRIIFINAWNEWAEGNYLEPCRTWGNKYLEVTKKVLKQFDEQ